MDYRNVLGQYIPADSPVHSLQPHTKLLLTAGLAVAVFLAGSSFELAVASVTIFAFTLLSRVSVVQYVRSLRPMIILVVIIMGIQLLLSQAASFESPHILSLEWGRVRQTLSMGVKLLELCWVAQWLTVTTSPVKVARGFESLLVPAERLGLPVQEIAMMATIALRFVPVVLGEAKDIIKAQASRGADFESLQPQVRLMGLVSILVPLVSRCWQRAEDMALSLEIRGYCAGDPRSHLTRARLGSADYVFLTVGFLVLLFITVHGRREWPV